MRWLRSLFAATGDPDHDAPEDFEDMPADSQTRIVIGLGNPGRKYAETRHNIGFFVVDHLARRLGAPGSRTRFKSEISEVRRGTGRFILVQPQTYMNDSGIALREVVNWYKAPLDQVIIVVDDLDIPYGEIRLRPKGSAGGHNGLKSIFQVMGTQEIPRLRIGIGRPRSSTISHVLSKFSKEEEADLERIVAAAADDVELWADRGIVEAMNIINDPANQPLALRLAEGS